MEEFDQIRDSVKDMQKKMYELVTKDEFNVTLNDVKSLKLSMEETHSDIKMLTGDLKKLKGKVDDMRFPSMGDFNALKIRVEKLEAALSSLKKVVSDLEKRLKESNGGGGGCDQDTIDRLELELSNLRAEFEAHRDHANANIDELNNLMPTKADKTELVELEDRILDKLREMVQ